MVKYYDCVLVQDIIKVMEIDQHCPIFQEICAGLVLDVLSV